MEVVQQSVELLAITEGPAELLERAGRTCYKSEDKITDTSAAKFVQMICRNKHESVIEHASATFRIICDRGISHEIVRHRLASYSQESTRYCNYGKEQSIKVIRPSGLTEEQAQRWEESCRLSEQHYLLLLKLGSTPQMARSVLPTCLKTEVVMTANFRTWKHFIAMRSERTAHPDVQTIAHMVNEELANHCPEIFQERQPINE